MSVAPGWVYDIVALPTPVRMLDFDHDDASFIPAGCDSFAVGGAESHVQRQIHCHRAIGSILIAGDEPPVIAAVNAECPLKWLLEQHLNSRSFPAPPFLSGQEADTPPGR